MKFFQNSVLHKHLKMQDVNAIQEAYAKFTSHFHDPVTLVSRLIFEKFFEKFEYQLFVSVFTA